MTEDVGNIKELLRSYEQLTNELLKSLTKPPTHIITDTASTHPVHTMDRIIKIDKSMMSLIYQLFEHKEKDHRATMIEEEILQKDKVLQHLVSQLKDIEVSLQDVIRNAKKKIDSFTKVTEAPIDVSDLVSYAHKICYTSTAPSGWNPGEPLVMQRPPMPQQEEIQQGLFYTKEVDALTTGSGVDTEIGGFIPAAASPFAASEEDVAIPTLDMSAGSLGDVNISVDMGGSGSLFGLQSSSESSDESSLDSDDDDDDDDDEEDDFADAWE